MLFPQAFVDYPVCSASKAAIYTGLHSHAHGIPCNTPNFFKSADQLTKAERNNPLYNTRSVPNEVPTMVELLDAAGYRSRVTSKLHVSPNEKFPYTEWGEASASTSASFLAESQRQGRPWFLWYNLSEPHRKFVDSDRRSIGVDPKKVEVPPFLPDTPVVRQDIAEYYDAIERADKKVGAVMRVLRESGADDDTIVIFMGDHGPAFQRGKMAPYDCGLRVPLIFAGPKIESGVVSEEVVGVIDLLPTLLDLVGVRAPERLHGMSLRPLLEGVAGARGHDYLVCQVQHQAQRHDSGMRERSIYDGRFRLIYRDKTRAPRTVNADIIQWESWGNRTYAETIAVQDRFPEQYELLRQIDNDRLGGKPKRLELYELVSDPYEMTNLIDEPAYAPHAERLMAELKSWAKRTGDKVLARAKP